MTYAIALAALAICANPPAPPAPTTTATTTAPATTSILDAADRDAADKALDAGRKPLEVFAFAGIKAGMKVGEIGSGGGAMAELLARAVGPTGVVYAVNNKVVLEKFAAAPWAERLKKPVMKNVVRVDREYDDPFPADVKELDVVVIHLIYHDTVWMNVDRKKMNAAVLKVLKKGGVYLVVDHSALAGHGLNDVQTFHRIDEKSVVDEVTAVGFVKDGDADFLRNPKDTRDWNDSPKAAAEKRGTSDRFVLRFKKP